MKMRGGGSKAVWNFPKTYPFWWRHSFLTAIAINANVDRSLQEDKEKCRDSIQRLMRVKTLLSILIILIILIFLAMAR